MLQHFIRIPTLATLARNDATDECHPQNDKKKVDPYRVDLEEAATYSPTGKPQYHRRE